MTTSDMPQRILVGYDGSECADRAIALVASLPWTQGSVIRLVTVAPDIGEIRSAWGPIVIGDTAAIEREIAVQAEAALVGARERARESGLEVETEVVAGRAPDALAAAARTFDATLVVVGSRGLGVIAATLLGSVSTEVVDLAPCPVLVARSGMIGSIVLATDGSECAERTERFLSTLPIAGQVPVRVVSVAEIPRPWVIGIAPTMYHEAIEAQLEFEQALRQGHRDIATATAARLAEAGIDARAELREGDPATEILAAAEAVHADLVVVGSRGRTGLTRLILGSVARRLVQRAPMSVLVMRTPETPTPAEGDG